MEYIAFDLGASSGKLFRGSFDGSHLALRAVHRFDNGAVSLGSGLYWDFLGIWQNLCLGLRKARREGAFHSFGIDTFSNDFSLIGPAGDLLLPMRCYRDRRTSRCADAVYRKMPPKALYRESGNQIAPFNTLMQLAAMREEGMGYLLERAHRLLFLPDLIAYYMTGEEIAERTVSSVSQMYDFRTGDWSTRILEAHGIPRALFGALTDPGTISGKAKADFQRQWATGGFDFVSVCEHDTASAFLAAPGGGEHAILSSGTWALVGCEQAGPIIDDFGFRHNIANEGSLPGHHRLLRNVMGSWILQELRREYQQDGEGYEFSEQAALAETCAPFSFLIDVDDPEFFAPGGMRQKIREKCWARRGGMPETRGEFIRCVCESLALKYRWALDMLETLTGRTFPAIDIIGGGAQDAFTCRLTADACRRPAIAGPADASAIGNILVQMIAHGEIRDVAEGREAIARSFPRAQYEPGDEARWRDAYGDFVRHFAFA